MKTADKIRDEIEYYANNCDPGDSGEWINLLEWYLHGLINGARWFGDLTWDEGEDILKNHLPGAMEWFRLREVKQHKTA